MTFLNVLNAVVKAPYYKQGRKPAKNFLNSKEFQGNLDRKFMYSTVLYKNVKQISSIIPNGKQRDVPEKFLSIPEIL